MACEALLALFGLKAPSTWSTGRTELSQCSRHTVNENPSNNMKTNRIIAGWLMLPIAFLLLMGIVRLLRWALLPETVFTLAYD